MWQRDLSSLPCFGGAAVQISSKAGERCVAVVISSRMTKYQKATSGEDIYDPLTGMASQQGKIICNKFTPIFWYPCRPLCAFYFRTICSAENKEVEPIANVKKGKHSRIDDKSIFVESFLVLPHLLVEGGIIFWQVTIMPYHMDHLQMITRDSYITYMCSMCYIVLLSVLLIDFGKDKW